MKSLENLAKYSTADIQMKLIRVEHYLLRAVIYKQAYVPFLSEARKKIRSEYHRRLYGR